MSGEAEGGVSRVRLGPLAVSADSDKPLVGMKLSKGVVYAPANVTVNVGAFVDCARKQISGFVRGEMDAGKYGVLVADAEGVELQKEWTLGGGGDFPEWASSTLSVSAGVGLQREARGAADFNPRPYVNFDVRPTETRAKGAMVSLSLAQGQPVDLRPAYAIDRNASVEFPVTVTGHHARKVDADGTKRDDAFLNAHLHGVVGCWKFETTRIDDEFRWGGDKKKQLKSK